MEDLFSDEKYYDNDGNELDPSLIPAPGLCLLCKSYADHDPEENILCNLNRIDQRGIADFKCGEFIPKLFY